MTPPLVVVKIMNDDQLIIIGKIIKPHGVRGEMKIQLLTGEPRHFTPGNRLFIMGTAADEMPMECIVEDARPHKNGLLIFLDKIEDPDQAEKIRNRFLALPKSELTAPEEDEYFIFDLIGMSVSTTDGLFVGVLQDVLTQGPQDIYEIRHPESKKINLVPSCRQFIKSVDVQGRKMIIEPIDGLLSL